MQGVTYVAHQGALRSVERSVDDPLSSDAVNVHGTLHVLMAARDSRGVKRVVYASSSSVYGDNPALPKVEDQTPAPVSPYAVSKLAAEHYCRVFSKLYGVETVSLRYFNVFGPKQSPQSKYAAVIPLFMRAALQGEPLEIHGDGEQSRDFTYIDNVVQANRLALTTPGVGGEVFNVACNERHSLLDIVATLERLLGRELPRKHVARAARRRAPHAGVDRPHPRASSTSVRASASRTACGAPGSGSARRSRRADGRPPPVLPRSRKRSRRRDTPRTLHDGFLPRERFRERRRTERAFVCRNRIDSAELCR